MQSNEILAKRLYAVLEGLSAYDLSADASGAMLEALKAEAESVKTAIYGRDES